MPDIAYIASWMLASGVAAWLACRFTNERIASNESPSISGEPLTGSPEMEGSAVVPAGVLPGETDAISEGGPSAVPWVSRPYSWTWGTVFLAIICAALTGAVACLVTQDVKSTDIQLPEFAISLFCYMATLASGIIDIKLRVIPNAITFGLLGVRLLLFALDFALWPGSASLYLVSSVAGLAAFSLMLTVSGALTHGGVGGGDVKLVAAVGFGMGIWSAFYALFFALLIFAVVGITLLVLRRKHTGDSLPFAPFFYMGYAAVLLLGLY